MTTAGFYRTRSDGVIGPRRSYDQLVKRIETPNRHTVVFPRHHPSPSFLSRLAHPANFIYGKKYLDTDVYSYKTHTVGTGPLTLQHDTRGAVIALERHSDYWKQGLPYLDGITYCIIADTSARAKALRPGCVEIELRNLPQAEVDGLTAQMGDKVMVANVPNISNWGWPSMWIRSRSTIRGCATPCRWPSTVLRWPKPWGR